jgi:hypothetical protein
MWASTSPPSWQQEGRLRRERVQGYPRTLLPLLLELPATTGAQEAAAAINNFAATQAALNIRRLSEAEVSYGPPRTHEDVEVQEVRDLLSAAEDFVLSHADEVKDRSRGLWRARVLKEQQGAGAAAVVGIFDHLIVDAWSLRILSRVARSVPPTAFRASPDPYLEWIYRQRRTFVDPSPAAEYWRAIFPDKPPNSPCRIAECANPIAPLAGVPILRSVSLQVPAESILTLQKRFRTTVFVLLLGALAASIADSGDSDDVTICLFLHGRLPEELSILGCLYNIIPLRIRDRELGDPVSAVLAAQETWLSSMEHQAAPWDFILDTGSQPRISDPHPMGIMLNFQPFITDIRPPRFPESFQGLMHPKGSALTGITLDAGLKDGTLAVLAKADSARFTYDGLGGFLGRLSAKWEELVSLSRP